MSSRGGASKTEAAKCREFLISQPSTRAYAVFPQCSTEKIEKKRWSGQECMVLISIIGKRYTKYTCLYKVFLSLLVDPIFITPLRVMYENVGILIGERGSRRYFRPDNAQHAINTVDTYRSSWSFRINKPAVSQRIDFDNITIWSKKQAKKTTVALIEEVTILPPATLSLMNSPCGYLSVGLNDFPAL